MNIKRLHEIEAATSFLLSQNVIPAAPYLLPHLKRALMLIKELEDGESHSIESLASTLCSREEVVEQMLQALKDGGYKIEKTANHWKQILRVCVPRDGAEYILEYKSHYQLSHLSPVSTAYRFIPRSQGVPLELGIPGIYCIKNTKIQKVYVGQAKDTRTRWTNHISLMRMGKNGNASLCNDWKHCQYTDWIFVLLQFALVNRDQLEEEWMRKFSPDVLYNDANHVKAVFSGSID